MCLRLTALQVRVSRLLHALGKGRTGIVICCTLLMQGFFNKLNANTTTEYVNAAVNYFREKRGDGVENPDQIKFIRDPDFLPAVLLDAEVVLDQYPPVAGDLHNGLPRQRLRGKVSPVRQPLQNHSSLPHETSPLGKSI